MHIEHKQKTEIKDFKRHFQLFSYVKIFDDGLETSDTKYFKQPEEIKQLPLTLWEEKIDPLERNGGNQIQPEPPHAVVSEYLSGLNDLLSILIWDIACSEINDNIS